MCSPVTQRAAQHSSKAPQGLSSGLAACSCPNRASAPRLASTCIGHITYLTVRPCTTQHVMSGSLKFAVRD